MLLNQLIEAMLEQIAKTRGPGMTDTPVIESLVAYTIDDRRKTLGY